MNWEIGIDIYTLLLKKKKTDNWWEHAVSLRELYPVFHGDLNGKEVQKREDTHTHTHTHMPDSLCWTAEANTVFIPIEKKGNAKECSNYHTTVFISHASKVMFKIL